MSLTIIPTSQAEHIARSIEYHPMNVVYPAGNKDGERFFPDGEVYTRISEIERFGGRLVVLHSGGPNPNKGLVELEQVLGILKTYGLKNLEVFFLYTPYSMQDHSFRVGEINAAEMLINKLINYYSVKKFYTVDAHFYGRDWVEKYPITNVTAVPFLEAAAKSFYHNLVMISADAGSQRRTNILGVSKKRHNSYDIDIATPEDFTNLVKGKNVAVVDDLIETGGTLSRLYDTCKEHGASKVVSLITHGVLYSGVEKITRKYDKVFITNTIASPASNVDISSLVVHTLAE